MGKAAQQFFGARKKMDSEFRDAMEANGHSHQRPYIQSIAAKMGTASHKGCEVSLLSIAGGSKYKLDDSLQASIENLREKKGEIEFDNYTSNLLKAERKVIENLKIFHGEKIETIDPMKVEKRYSKEIGEGFVLSAQLDVIEYNGNIVDHKFGKLSAAGYMSQLGVGFMVSPDAVGDSARIIQIKNQNKIESVDCLINRKNATALAFQQLKKIIKQTKDYLKTGNPDSFEFNPGCMLCSEKYCSAFGTNFCRYTR
jgi:hypothetical protein